jgi:hypothetical protein
MFISFLGGDASTTSLASSQSAESAEIYVNSYDYLSDDKNLSTHDKVYVANGREGFRRGRIDYNSLGVLRTKPGLFLLISGLYSSIFY